MASVLIAIAVTPANAPVKPESATTNSYTAARSVLRQQEQAKEIWMGDVLVDDNTLSYNGYVVEKRNKKVRYDYSTETRNQSSWIDVSYVVLKRQGKVLVTFDDGIYFGMGNSTRFGLFSFLPGPAKQLVVSQDVFRGGTQWVVNLSPRPRIIFDGPKWGVGREGDDMTIVDVDNDGVFEIIVPITDFYEFQDKLPIARIPLPEIIFKYDERVTMYAPANPLFESYFVDGTNELVIEETSDEFDRRALVLEKLLTLIYVGKQKQAWDFYDRSYTLADKEEIRRRVKDILTKQPVYKFIYNSRSRK